ncbi:MAG: fibronectin type III domain-containing protein, partial [Candidatus Marinimicrobia bacterium]|nr:fibronectin type III domain-containing protein [Candidatus Neomarinimicrobiota bacterium]
GPRGASITLEQSASVTFEKIYFLNNTLYNNTSTSAAGAVWMSQPGSEFYYCRFENNNSFYRNMGDSQSTGAIGIDGWGTESENKYTLIDGCEFINNQGRNEGGAINARHNTVIQNSLFYKNRVDNGGSGGAIAAMPQVSGQGNNYDTYLHVINCTFVENSATGQGGAIKYYGSNGPIIFNSIFMNNRRYSEQSNEELNDFMGGADNNKPKVNYVRVDESTVATTDRAEWGNNIYFDPPAFTDTTKENFTLTSASTLIGTGTSSFEGVSSPNKDINGNMRPNPSGSNPDLGAYENSLAESPFPSQVKNVKATVSSQTVNLSWDANSETDIEKYLIYISPTSGFEPTSENIIGESATNSFSATGLANNMEYYFQVAAVDSNGYRGALSQEVSAIPQYLGPTWWVSNDGSDTGDGSEFNPIANLGEALKRVNSGDTIAIKAGLYTGDANAGLIDDQIFQQQDGSPKPSMELTIKGVTGNALDVVFNGEGNGKQRFFIFQRRDPYNDKIRIENITFQNEFHNGETNNSPGGGGAIAFFAAHTELVFENVMFLDNDINQSSHHDGGGAVMIHVAEGKKPPMFIKCGFIDNVVRPKDGTGNETAVGGAVCIEPGWEGSGGDPFNQPAVIFDQCYFGSNRVHSSNPSSGHRTGSAIQSQANIIIRNSVFTNNHFSGLGQSRDATVDIQPQYVNDGDGNRYSGRAILINNTFYDNPGEKIISLGSSDKESARFFIYSNIFSEYKNIGIEVWRESAGVDFYATANLFDRIDPENADYNYMLHQDIQILDGGGDVIGDPRFKGEAIKNFELTPSSPAIDMGINSLPPGANDELGGDNAPVFDIRDYYRVGIPDIGAFEFGASKYILAMVDDIAEDKDTTFVALGQELKITVTTGDIDGNLVSSNENMTWNIFPNQKYVKYVSGDKDTEGGDATATFEVTSQVGGKGFRFRIEAGVGDAFMRSGMYVIEELVTGAPPPVANLTISPSDWTSDPNFTLNWETPTWAAQRGLIGAVVEITDGINVYNEYMGFPSGDTLTNYSFTAPEAGQYDAHLWLIDELGNEDQDSAMSVTAYFDNVTPEAFQ